MPQALVNVRHNDISPVQRVFLAHFADCGNIRLSADLAGVHRTSHYDWLAAEGIHGLIDNDDLLPAGSYAKAFLLAKKQAADRILERSERQSLSDEDTMPNTIARIFHIKRWYPQYRDSLQVRHSGAVLSARLDLNQMEAGDRTALLELALQRERRLLTTGDNVAAGSEETTEAGG